MKAAQMAAIEHGTGNVYRGNVYRVGCDIERELNAANQRIKQLEEAGNALLFYFCPKNTGDVSFLQSEAIKQWNQAKEDKP
jgi:hypothetical protein